MQSSGRDAPRDLIYAQPPAVDAAFLAKAVLVAGATLLGASALVAATNAREMRMANCILAMGACNKSRSQWVTQVLWYGVAVPAPYQSLVRGFYIQMHQSGSAKVPISAALARTARWDSKV